jgi:hypothetical protein
MLKALCIDWHPHESIAVRQLPMSQLVAAACFCADMDNTDTLAGRFS